MRNLIIFLTTILILSCNTKLEKSQSGNSIVESIPFTIETGKKQLLELDSLDIKFQLRGNCYAYSSLKNAKKSNGEAHSDNLPKNVNSNFIRNGLYLTINEKEKVKYTDVILGSKLYLVNTTDSIAEFNATDSRIDIYIEALDKNKKWKSISYIPYSTCGNSYHTIKLDKDEFWSFDIPIFKGNFKTKLRYVLDLNENNKIVSNEINTFINEEQFDTGKKQGYSNNNIMNPYNE